MSKGDPPDATLKARAPTARSFAGGRYTVQRLLGEGGQKVVYLVRDTALDRECALAWIKLHGLDADDVERLRQEAMLMARLGAHPNIVTVYDIGGEEGRPYVISEYVAGGDLAGLVREAGGPLPIDRALAIAGDLAGALAAAHEHGVVHRDLKPANVWLTETGAAKLGDFGLALALDRSRLTQAGTMVGTAAYMAPEQALGGDVDGRSDLYALGAVLYEMLTGRPPFLGDNVVAVVSQHISTAPVAPSWHNAEVPRPLEALILRLLAKAPEERPESAAAVSDALRSIGQRPSDETALEQPVGPAGNLQAIAWGRFVGRGEEMEELKAAVEGAVSGRGGLVLLVGEPGIGKTRLAEELATYASLRGAQVLWGRCYEGEGAPAYWPWVQAIRGYVHNRASDELLSEMGSGAADIAQMVSEVRERLPDLPTPPALEPEQARFRLFDSVSTFLKKAADHQPLILIFDDLHWADKPSLLLLQFLARELKGARLLVVGTYRDAELGRQHPLTEALAELHREQLSRRVLLRGLPQEDVLALLTAIEPSEESAAGREALGAALHRETEGNPFFIREVLSHLVEEGKLYWEGGRWTAGVASISDLGIPAGVREVVGRRLSRLSEACNRMLTRASAMTGDFTWEALRAISDEPEERLLDLLEEGLAAQLIEERRGDSAGSYRFTHALIRQTLYEELSTPRRVMLHRRIGEALEEPYSGRIGPHLAELAHHFFLAAPGGDVEKAMDYARQAGNRANALSAFEEAVRLYQMALQALDLKRDADHGQRCELLLALGEVQMNAGDFSLGSETFRLGADAARKVNDSDRFGLAALWYVSAAGPGERDRATDLLQEALRLLPEEDSALRAEVMARLAERLPHAGFEDRRAALSQEAAEMARRVGDAGALASVLRLRRSAFPRLEDDDELVSITAEMAHLAERTGDRENSLVAHYWLLTDMLVLGDMRAFAVELEEHARLTEELGHAQAKYAAARIQAMLALLEGRFEEGERLAHEALLAGQRTRQEDAVQVFGAQLFVLRREQGRLAELEGAARHFVERYPAIPVWRCSLAFLYSELGRHAEAWHEFGRLAANDFADLPRDLFWDVSMVLLSEVCAALDDTASAPGLYRCLLPYARRNVVVSGYAALCLGSASRYLGLLATTMALWEDAERHFEDALEMNTRMGARPWVAWTQHDYASMLLRRDGAGDREKARALLAAALATTRELGMVALERKVLALQEEFAL